MEEIVNATEWRERLDKLGEQVKNSFRPGQEPGFSEFDIAKAETKDRLDLDEIPEGSIVCVNGSHLSATYILRVDGNGGQRRVSIWQQNVYSTGLTGKVSDTFSYKSRAEGDVLVERGVLRTDCVFLWPYFEYRNVPPETREVFKEVLPPKEVWLSHPIEMWIQFPNKCKEVGIK